jgi:serine/threonine protein kinase
MGAVYRVWDLKRNVPLAMKVLHTELAEDPTMFRRFQREANALKKLAHPNIVPFYGMYQAPDFAFLLERYIDGPSLKDILKQHQGKALSIQEALVFMKALSAALGYAHANGVVHCDVKPGNVLVDRGGSVYLTDFGIARYADSTVTSTGAAGTPAYMAPEQIRGESVTPSTDIYSLGVVLYEMLTGQRPFRGTEAGTEKGGLTNNERIRYGHLYLTPPDPRSFNPELSGALSAVLLKALEKQPHLRYRSTQEFYGMVCAAVGDYPVPEQLAPTGEGIWQPPIIPAQIPALPKKPLNTYLIIGGVLGSVILCVVAVLIFLAGRPRASLVPTQITAVQSGGLPSDTASNSISQSFTPSQTFTAELIPLASSPTFTPTQPNFQPTSSGKWIAYDYGNEQNKRDLYMINWQNQKIKQITFGGQGDNGPSFSPDGASLVFSRCASGTCKLVIRDGNGNERSLTDYNSMWPSWCKNPARPSILYENRADGGNTNIWMIDLNSGQDERLTNGGNDGGPEWSPDCSQFSFNHGEDIYLFKMDTRSETQLTFAQGSITYSTYAARWSPDGQWLVYNILRDTDGNGFPQTAKDDSDLMVIHADGSGKKNLTHGRYWAYSPSWSPDGTKILFADHKPNGMQFVIYDFQQSTFDTLTDIGPFYHPVWGP